MSTSRQDLDLNPIVFLNTYVRMFNIKDKFEYRYRLNNDKFICSLKFKDHYWESVEKPGKKQAKEDVARIVVNYLAIQDPDKYEQIESGEGSSKSKKDIQTNPVEKKALTGAQASVISKIGQNVNPIIFLNTYTHRFNITDKLQYKYKLYNNKFICRLKFKDHYWESVEKLGKKQAKEDVARIAVAYLTTQDPEKCERIIKFLRNEEISGSKKNVQVNQILTKVTLPEVTTHRQDLLDERNVGLKRHQNKLKQQKKKWRASSF
jgi:hypothetical protein